MLDPTSDLMKENLSVLSLGPLKGLWDYLLVKKLDLNWGNMLGFSLALQTDFCLAQMLEHGKDFGSVKNLDENLEHLWEFLLGSLMGCE